MKPNPTPSKEHPLHEAALEHRGGILQEMRDRKNWLDQARPFWQSRTGAIVLLAAVFFGTNAALAWLFSHL